jgi:hypothetical protein
MGGKAEVSRGKGCGGLDALGAWSTVTPGRQGQGARGEDAPGCRFAYSGVGAGTRSEARKKEKVARVGSKARFQKEKDRRRKLRREITCRFC